MKAKILRLRVDVLAFPDGRWELHFLEPDRGKSQYLARLRKWRRCLSHYTRDPITSKLIAGFLDAYVQTLQRAVGNRERRSN